MDFPGCRINPGLVVLLLGVLRARVTFQLDFAAGQAPGQDHHSRSRLNGKRPLRPGDIPVELVVILEESKLASRLVLDLVGVLAPIENPILSSNIETNPCGQVLRMEGFPLAVARHPVHLKRNGYACKERAAVEGWEIAIDTSSDFLSLGLDRDRLRDNHGAVLADHDAAVVAEDPLRLRQQTGTQPSKPEGQDQPESHGSSIVVRSTGRKR